MRFLLLERIANALKFWRDLGQYPVAIVLNEDAFHTIYDPIEEVQGPGIQKNRIFGLGILSSDHECRSFFRIITREMLEVR